MIDQAYDVQNGTFYWTNNSPKPAKEVEKDQKNLHNKTDSVTKDLVKELLQKVESLREENQQMKEKLQSFQGQISFSQFFQQPES